MRPQSAPVYMKALVSRFNDETITEESEDADIIEMAARYCHVFVNIYPFDGNRRMCRMLLNVILLKFLGVCVVIGEESRIGLITWL